MKRRLLPLPIIFAVLFAPLQGGGNSAYACSCLMTTAEERVEAADVVAVGTVHEVYDDSMTVEFKDGETLLPDVDAVFEIATYYKGQGANLVRVDDPPDGGTCGFISAQDVGQRAILYMTGSGHEFTTHICAGSGFLPANEAEAAPRLAELEAVTGPGEAPHTFVLAVAPVVETGGSDGDVQPQEESEGETKDTPWAVILPLAFGIPLAVLVIPSLLRRRGGGD